MKFKLFFDLLVKARRAHRGPVHWMPAPGVIPSGCHLLVAGGRATLVEPEVIG